jgi:streptogramin lyase
VRQLADGDLLVLRGGRPVRVHPADGAQSLYSNAIGSVTAASIASNGDLVFASPTTGGAAVLERSTSPEATPLLLVDAGPGEKVGSLGALALDADDRVVFLGIDRELTDGVETDSNGAIFEHDPVHASTRVLSRRPTAGGIATGADGRLFVASLAGTAFNLREVDPRTGETRRAAAGPLFTRPFDAAVEADGRVVVLNGIPNGIPSVLRVDPDTGDTVELSPTDQLVDPEKIAVGPNGDVFVADAQVGILRIDPVTGAQSLVPDSDALAFLDDLEVEAAGSLLAAEQAGERLWRVDPTTGAREEVGPILDLIQALEEPQGYGGFSALALGLDGAPWASLVAMSAPNDYALFRAPTDATDVARISELPLCRGDDLEVVRAVPEPSTAAAACAALACLGQLRRARARPATPSARSASVPGSGTAQSKWSNATPSP